MPLLLLKLRKIKRWVLLFLFTDLKPRRPGCWDSRCDARVDDNLRDCWLLLCLILEKRQQLGYSLKTAIEGRRHYQSNLVKVKYLEALLEWFPINIIGVKKFLREFGFEKLLTMLISSFGFTIMNVVMPILDFVMRSLGMPHTYKSPLFLLPFCDHISSFRLLFHKKESINLLIYSKHDTKSLLLNSF